MPSQPKLDAGATDTVSTVMVEGKSSYRTLIICVVVGLVCLLLGSILGLFGGYIARARLFPAPVAVTDLEFVINHRRDTEQSSKYWIELTPKDLRIEKWYIDEKEYDGQPVDIKIPLTPGDHTVEVKCQYRGKEYKLPPKTITVPEEVATTKSSDSTVPKPK